jgi:hypothetical protein
MSFPPGTEMFQFPGFASPAYGFSGRSPMREGFPHSDIRGSTIARISPRLFAACHVLHRLLAPRHPPNALFTLRIATATARTQNRAAPNEGHAPSRMRGCGSRTIRAHSHSQNYTTNSGFTCERTKASPAHGADEVCLLEAVPDDGRRAEAKRPSIQGIPTRAGIEHRPSAPCGARGTGRMSGHQEWRTEPGRGFRSSSGSTTTDANARTGSRSHP